MAGIQDYLNQIMSAVYGRDVRQAIHDGIHQCYEDGKAGTVDLVAREEIAELIAPSGEAPSAAEVTDARIGTNGVSYTSLGDAVRTQVSGLDSVIVDELGKSVEWEIGRTGRGQSYKTGGTTGNANCNVTKYIDVSKYKRLKYMAFCSTASSTAVGIAFFTGKTEDSYISGVAGYGGSSAITMKEQWAEVPENAVYARFTVAVGYDNFYIMGFTSVTDQIGDLKSLGEPEYTNTFASGAITASGSTSSNNTRIRNEEYDAPEIQVGDFVYFGGEYEGRVCVYNSKAFSEDTFVKWLDAGFTQGYEYIPYDCAGYYCGIVIRKIGSESSDISADVSNIGNYVKYYRVSFNPLAGKKLSVMGDSISALNGFIPEGYDAYYSGSNHGITSVNQMWWKVLADRLGLDICVINGYSGSAVTQLEDSGHINKIPMSSDERTAGLSDGANIPDIIIIAGGVNDYTYAQSAQSEPLEWDGKSVPVLSNSFTEAYACMIKKIQTNYPNAIVVALSTWFTMRGVDNGYTLTHAVGDNVYTQDDYNKAIENVCHQMRIPYIDVSNIGFNRNNFYPTYAEDSATIPTHPNAAGHRVMGLAIAEKIVPLISGFEF